MKREQLNFEISRVSPVRIVVSRNVFGGKLDISPLECGIMEGENPVFDPDFAPM